MNRIIFIIFVLSATLSACDENPEIFSDTEAKNVSFSPRIESAAALPQNLYIYTFNDLKIYLNQYSGPFSGVSVPLYYHGNYGLALTTAPVSAIGASLPQSYYVQLKNSTDMTKYVNGIPPYIQDPNLNLFYQYYTVSNVSASTAPVVNNLVLQRIEAKATARFTPQVNETKAYMSAVYSYGKYDLNGSSSNSLKTTIGSDVVLSSSITNEVSVKFLPYIDPAGTAANIAASRTFLLRVYNNSQNKWTDYQLKLADGMPLSAGFNYVFYPTGSQLVFEPTLVENWGTDIVLNN